MKIVALAIVTALIVAPNIYAQSTIEGVTLEAEYQSGDKVLVLNGGGVRTKFFLSLYVAGLYVSDKSSDSRRIVDADEAMSIRLSIISDLITSKEMISSTETGFRKSTNGKQEELRTDIDILTSAFSTEIKKGDSFDIVYTPGNGVAIYKNGIKTTSVGDLAFKKALWGIWLSDDPVDKNLKSGLLGLNS